MVPSNRPGGERIVLHPGEYRVSKEPATFATLLGSCVAVCMYDPVRGAMGMNHFLLAERRSDRERSVLDSDAGRYGIHAMELLINGLLKCGAQRRNLRAKAFGGGNVLGVPCDELRGFTCVGNANVRFVREFLENDSIPLLAADLGGNYGRRIQFTGDDYSVYVRKIDSLQSHAVVEEERIYWRDHLQEEPQAPPDFW